MIKFKHYFSIDGAGQMGIAETIQAAEDFVNQENINTVEVNHSFTPSEPRSLSIFIAYAELDSKQKKAIKDGVEKADKEQKKTAEGNKKKKVGKGTAKKKKPSVNAKKNKK